MWLMEIKHAVQTRQYQDDQLKELYDYSSDQAARKAAEMNLLIPLLW